MTAGSCFPILGVLQRRNNHTALGILLGLHKEVSTRSSLEAVQSKVREIQGQVQHLGVLTGI